MTTMPAINGGFEVNVPGDPVDLCEAEFMVLDLTRDPNAWLAGASYAIMAMDGPEPGRAFAAVLAKRLLSVYPVCRDRDDNQREFLSLFDGPPESTPTFECLRRLSEKAPAPKKPGPSKPPTL